MIRFAALDHDVVKEQLIGRKISKAIADRAADMADGSLGLAIKWIEDGVFEASDQLMCMLQAMEAGGGARDLPHWFKQASESYAAKQLERDELGSKDQATREGLALYLRLASEHFRRRLPQVGDDADALESLCGAVDAVVLAETYIDSNVNVPLALQQLAASLDRTFAMKSSGAAKAR